MGARSRILICFNRRALRRCVPRNKDACGRTRPAPCMPNGSPRRPAGSSGAHDGDATASPYLCLVAAETKRRFW
ncbi:hypothetical protein NDU88_006359 [Pleurodeles waltl]|uniref:Uncharacterized protein n=1 Tax=Pleurodeles waltl TaxID=8319 RepID=A0AAV7LRR6_PLEWA|nr:hypothetical protein NDU88_006359 [Pleurodeles waltl]